jgi:hypothetical protein
METVCFSGMLVSTHESTCCHNPEEQNHQVILRYGELNCLKVLLFFYFTLSVPAFG